MADTEISALPSASALTGTDTKISALPSASALTGTEQIPATQGTNPVKLTVDQISSKVQGDISVQTSTLPSASALTGTEMIPATQNVTNPVKITVNQLSSKIQGDISVQTSTLPSASALTGTEQIPATQNGTNPVKLTVDQISSKVQGDISVQTFTAVALTNPYTASKSPHRIGDIALNLTSLEIWQANSATPALTSWNRMSSGYYGGSIITDLNMPISSGCYTALGTASNVPNSSYSWFIDHINSNTGNVSAYQRAVAYSTTLIIFERTKINSVWGDWIPVLKNEQVRSQNVNTSPSSKLFDDINVDYDNSQMFIYNHIFKVDHSILLNNGAVSYNERYPADLVVSDYIPLSMVYGCTIGKLEAWRLAQGNPIAFFDKNKVIIGSAYNPATIDTGTSVSITINSTLLAQYPNAYYVRFGGKKSLDLVIKNDNNEKRLEMYKNELRTIFKDKNIVCNTFLNVEGTEFSTNLQWDNQKSVLLAKDTGILTSGVGSEGYFCVSPFLPIHGISKIHFSGYIFDNTALCVQYDINKSIISVLNATNNTETDVDVDNNAYYIRFCGDCRVGHDIPVIKFVDITCENYQNKLNLDFYDSIIKTDNFYKINNFDNAIFCGDSVTIGFVVEGTSETQYIYKEIPEKSYPMQFSKMFPKINVTVKAQSGISAIDYLKNTYPTIDYTQYDLVAVELGLNGYLNYDDLNIEGTNTNCYRKIIQGIRQQNKNSVIVLNRSSHFASSWIQILQYIASESKCIVLDLTSRKYLNLDDVRYHGYYQNGSERAIDMAHFTRKGYNAKAFVFSKLLEEQLSDSTLYN